MVMWKHPGHFTSMKKLLGALMSLFNLCLRLSSLCDGNRRSDIDNDNDDIIHYLDYMLCFNKLHRKEEVTTQSIQFTGAHLLAWQSFNAGAGVLVPTGCQKAIELTAIR